MYVFVLCPFLVQLILIFVFFSNIPGESLSWHWLDTCCGVVELHWQQVINSGIFLRNADNSDNSLVFLRYNCFLGGIIVILIYPIWTQYVGKKAGRA